MTTISESGLRIGTWNINGIKSLLTHSCVCELDRYNLDVLLLQEVRTGNVGLVYQLASILKFPYVFYNFSDRTGHAGVATLSKLPSINQFIPSHITPGEGRIMVIEIDEFAIVNLYAPFIGQDSVNFEKRSEWEVEIREFLQMLKVRGKTLIVGGDLNVAPELKDRFKVSKKQPGCSVTESTMFHQLLNNVGLRDAYREVSDEPGYTWGVNEAKLRIDFFLIDKQHDLVVNECYPVYDLHTESTPSDHYPLIIHLTRLP
jgi:exodeoxyribonuclease-3